MTDWRKKYPRPTPESVWCDECLRWETGHGPFDRPSEPRAAKLLYAIARWVWRLGSWFTNRADYYQIQANIKNGVFDVRNYELAQRLRS
jgi:hypothetical protein